MPATAPIDAKSEGRSELATPPVSGHSPCAEVGRLRSVDPTDRTACSGRESGSVISLAWRIDFHREGLLTS